MVFGLINEAYLFDAGWLFFAGWSVVILSLSLIAFGQDLIPYLWQEQERTENHSWHK
jgi:hypothetical protein